MLTANQVHIDYFLAAIVDGQPVLSTLGLTPTDFIPDSFEKLLDNARDVGRGVTAVSRKSDMLFFGLFNQVEAKEYGDRGVQYIFTGSTQDAAAITHLAQLLRRLFGQGIHDDNQYLPFENAGALARLVGSSSLASDKTLLEIWPGKYATCTLRYSAEARHGLLLAVHQQPTPVPDVVVRDKGTVADLLRLNLAQLLELPELRKEVELQEGALKFVTYYFHLAELELGVFDQAQVRIFGSERASRADLPVNLTLTCSQPPSHGQLIQVVEQLVRLYGPDGNGSAELAPYEVDKLRGDWWTGRMWVMTKQHRPRQPDGEEPTAYVLDLSLRPTAGFKLEVHGYNMLSAR